MYQVITANNGVEALQKLEAEPNIKLVITDYNMPKMNGFELTKTLRREYDKNELIIIGLSSNEKSTLSAQFIKNGANDFLSKPFIQEEFHCRITHNIETQEHLEKIKNWAFKDALTGLYNRRYLFEQEAKLHAKAKQAGELLSIAVIDIDYFKKINAHSRIGCTVSISVKTHRECQFTSSAGGSIHIHRRNGKRFAGY